MTKALTIILAVGGLLALAVPAEAQRRGGGGGGGRHHGGGGFHHGGHHHHHGGTRVGFYFGGFGYPYYFGAPYYAYPYYGYPYGYPTRAYYTYDPRGVYEGRVANPPRSTNDGAGKDGYSMTARVQRQLASAGFYRGQIDGIAGEGTRQAIRNYERANGLPVDGRIDDQLLDTMGLG